MKVKIRHRRLYAFYNSKVLNALMLVIVVALLQIGCAQSIVMPVVCASVALALFVGYSLWLWIKKPVRVVINSWLSDVSGWFTLYFLIVVAMRSENHWWYDFPAVCAVFILFIAMVRPHDEYFDIDI